ncbi:envelope stress response membrane protein PspB [Altericroceibacterium spongiae]|uniref:Envelope stress response membrane protein PspB n=1 Tax=Altericroceibacterium spongiae TaxID=2320269 RepID=A0A420EQS6_9SPHN|nr:envelope stress response membrane protein PspB [Altericroceibacterium spongiae]RKF23046.1 envelope stress response membrane protein PspB [Altericroceibacterium spongiae]
MDEVIIVATVVIGVPWVVLHYITKWKTAATLTNDDETLLEDLYQLARRLDERMNTVERLVASDNPEFKPHRLREQNDMDSQKLHELDRMLNERGDRK